MNAPRPMRRLMTCPTSRRARMVRRVSANTTANNAQTEGGALKMGYKVNRISDKSSMNSDSTVPAIRVRRVRYFRLGPRKVCP